MNRRSAAFALIAILALTQFGSQLATAETAATVYATPVNKVFEISNLQEEGKIRVDLVFEPTVTAIDPILKEVAFGDRHDQSLFDLFKAKMEELPPDSKAVPVLLITFKTKSLRTGSYKLRIELRDLTPVGADKSAPPAKPARTAAPKSTPAPAARKGPQFLDLELKLPPATIKTTDKLVIEQVRHGILADAPPTLNLTGISTQEIRLTDITIQEVDLSGKENVANPLKVKFDKLDEIAPFTTKRSEISLEGTFPLGVTSRTVLISAPQLSAPVFVSFEVKARRAKWIIVAVMVLGLFLGFAVRIWVKKRMELQEARLKALAAYEIIEREAKRPDAEFGRLVKPSLTALETAIKGGNVEALNKAITDANTVLAAAVADLNSRRDIAKRQLETLTRLAKNRPMLPIAIAEAITIDGAALETARGLLATDDVAGAQQSMKPSITTLGDALGAAASTWCGNAKSLLDQAVGVFPFVSESISTGLTLEKESHRLKLDECVPTTDASSLDDISKLFDSLRNLRRVVSEFVNRAGTQLANSLNSLKSQFDLVPEPHPDLIKGVFKKAAELLEKFPAWTERPEIGANELQKALDDLTALWRAALLAQITGTDADLVKATKQRVETLLQENHHRDAAFEVIVFLKDHPLDDSILGETGDHSVAKASETFSLSAGIWSFLDLISGKPSDTSLTMVSTVREQIPPSLEALRTRTLKELILGKLVTFAIASLIIMGIGYSLFAQTFVGTFNELMSVFMWAFGLNISIDGVVESMKKTKLE